MSLPRPPRVEDKATEHGFRQIHDQFPLGPQHLADDSVGTDQLQDSAVSSGTYAPSLTNVTNLDGSAASDFHYMRVGSVVTVAGRLTIDPTTTATSTELGITLPIASNFGGAASEDCGGVAAANGFLEVFPVLADNTNDRARLLGICQTNTSHALFLTFTYQIN